MPLPVQKGITAAAVFGVPDKWSKEWFQGFITNFLVGADIRNVVATGLTISGNVSGNSTVGVGTTVTVATSFANPTASIGLTTINGTSSSAMRSDAAPALSQAISPVMTGNWTFSPTSGVPLVINVPGANNGIQIFATAGNNSSLQLIGNGGSTTTAFTVNQDGSGNANLRNRTSTGLLQLWTNNTIAWTIGADGGMTSTGVTGGDQGVGTINAAGLFVNGVAVGTSALLSSNNTWTGTNTFNAGITATTVNATSDPRLKKKFRRIKDSGEILDNISGYRFKWKADNTPSIGINAKEIAQVTPELVTSKEDILSVNYNGLIAVLIEEVKSLRKRVEELEQV